MSKLICNVGYIGEGEYKSMVNYKEDPAYRKWYDMLKRCYTTKPLKSQECYIGCIVDTDWHNYQNFAQVEQAFMAYKNYKQQLIKQEADKYKTILPDKVYNAIINYEIDIND